MPLQRTRETLREVLALRRNGYSGPFFVAFAMTMMGIWLFLPLGTFETSESYSVMSELASEEFWGLCLGVVGGLLVGASLARKPREVAWAALLASGLWFLVAVSFASGNPASAVMPVLFVMAVRSLSLYYEFMFHFLPEEHQDAKTK